MVPVGHAGDGGGSLRIPASMCGLFGLKPTRGRVSLGPAEHESWAGLVARHVVTRTVRDSASVLDVVHGYMTGDWYTAPPPGRAYAREVNTEPGALRIGTRTNAPLGLAAVDPACVTAVEETARLLESLGHTVEEAGPPALDDGTLLETFTTVMVSSLRADLAEVAEIIGRPVTADDVEAATWANYEAGAGIDAGAYVTALKKMQAWARRTIAWWFDDGFDLLLTPSLAEPPPLLGELTDPQTGGGRLLPFVLFTAPFNVTGQPAMSVPLAMSPAGLPVGVQFVGAPYREDLLFRVAGELERAQPWADRRPSVHA
jgi:amidase